MYGLINRAIEGFVRDTYGAGAWRAVIRQGGLAHAGYEAMLGYEPSETLVLLDQIEAGLHRPRDELLEDIGTYLVSHPRREGLRRLLRFGGVTFEDFLRSLDELPDWARLAVPSLELPAIRLEEEAPGRFTLALRAPQPGWGRVLMGLLRALADDYGTLALVDHQGSAEGEEWLRVSILDSRFAEGRRFDLGAGPPADTMPQRPAAATGRRATDGAVGAAPATGSQPAPVGRK